MMRSLFLGWILVTIFITVFPSFSIETPDMSAPFINELNAAGSDDIVILDEDEGMVDWIEIHNPTDATQTLGGWQLTDDLAISERWEFPDVAIAPKGYLVVFASGKNRRPADGSNLHTNFRLSSSGEILALIDDNGFVRTLFTPSYPPQRSGFSFGYDPAEDRYRYMNLTPGQENETTEAFDSFFDEEVLFSVERGYYSAPFEVELSFDSPSAEIRFTIDGSSPCWAKGSIYEGPIQVERTTTLRAIALIAGVGRSDITTHTYFFNLSAAQRALPALSLVTDDEYMFGPDGIASSQNAHKEGRAYERPVSVEYLIPGKDGEFQIDGGIRVHGQLGRQQLKKSYRLYFRDDYGDPNLVYPLFPVIPVIDFSRLVLRSGVQDTNPFIMDEMARSIYGDMGQVTSHGTFAGLFQNGVYMGYYNPVERYDGYFFRAWHGGDEEWDVIRHSGLTEGSDETWNTLLDKVSNLDLSNREDYNQVAELIDVENFVDYLLINISGGTDDWPHNNWTAARRQREGARFRFYLWDAEQIFGGGDIRVFRDTVENSLALGNRPIPRLYQGLHQSPEFRSIFASRFRKHFYEDGALTDTHQMDRFIDLRLQMLDVLPNPFPTISLSWVPGRRHVVEKILHKAGLLEFVDVPVSKTPSLGELPEVDVQFPPGSPDLTADAFVDASDLVEFLDQQVERERSSAHGRRSFRDENWERFDYPVELGTRSLVTIDFNHDGNLDLGASSSNHDSISLFANRGDGTFLEPTKVKARLAGIALGKGDINQDDVPDLVVASDLMLRHEISVLLSDGVGGFDPAVTEAFNDSDETINLHPRSINSRDLDLDGDLDVVVQNESSAGEMVATPGVMPFDNVLSIFMNDGQGNLVATDTITSGSPILTSERALVSEDLDGDGDVDLVTLSGRPSLLLFVNQGDGSFADPVEISPAGIYHPLIALVGADFDDDGDVDLSACSNKAATVYFLRNDGNAQFTAAEDLTTRLLGPKVLLAEDFNSDGKADLLVANFDRLLRSVGPFNVLYNLGEGGFEVSEGFFTTDEVPFPESLAAGDFDGDGDKDIAAADEYNGTLTVFLNQLVPSPPSADINGDNSIDFLDVLEIGQRWEDVTGP